MTRLLLPLPLILTISCTTPLRIETPVNASREETRDAFAAQVLASGGFIVRDSDLSAEGDIPTVLSGSETLGYALAGVSCTGENVLANFGGSDPCLFVAIPRRKIVNAHGVPYYPTLPDTPKNRARFEDFALRVKTTAER